MATKFDWVGPWFTPVLYKHYLVPENAANYFDLHGRQGQCIGFSQSSFGHVWALIMFSDNGELKPVRTSYLEPVNGEHDKLIEDNEASMTVAEKAEYALRHSGNHGNIVNYNRE